MRAVLLPVLLALPAMALAHGDAGVRYVSAAGIDAGACHDPHDACRTLAYAAVRIGKVGEVRVAAGFYHIDELEELYFVATRAEDLAGGYSPDFKHRDPAKYATAEFSCSAVDLLAQIALADFSSRPTGLNDIWGFLDLNTEREYALVGLLNGVAVLDVADPTAPFEVGTIGGPQTVWRDLKVLQIYDEAASRWRAYGYVSADAAQDHLTIIDFNGLPNRVGLLTRTTPDRSAHTLSVTGVDLALNIPLPGREPLLIQAG